MKYNFFVNTTPPRLKEGECLRKAVDSLLSQTLPPETVYVCIPRYYRRFDVIVDDHMFPNWLRENPRIKIIMGYDYGPASRYMYAFKTGGIMCAADDDVIYNPDALERLANFKDTHSLDAASNWSYLWWNWHDKDGNPNEIDFSLKYLQGVDMILTDSSFFSGFDSFLEESHKEHADSFLYDDLTCSYYLQYTNRSVGSLFEGDTSESVYSEQVTASDDTRLTDELGRGERYFKTFQIISYLKENYPIKKLNSQH